MKILNVFFTLVTIVFLTSCNSSQKATKQNMKIETFWINSSKVDCVGVGPMSCMQIQKGDIMTFKNWQNFYSRIEGFTYQPGYIYKLEVEDLDPKLVPADAPSKRYKLVEVLKKEEDKKMRINDIWVLTNMNGEALSLDDDRWLPRLEVNLAQRKIMGKGVCNRMFGELLNHTAEKIEIGKVGMTRRMCMNNASLESEYAKLIEGEFNYKVENNSLILSRNGKELLKYKKVD